MTTRLFRAFVIRNMHRFLTQTVPRYFDFARKASFQRQLQLYDFETDPYIRHEMFVQSCPELTRLMQRCKKESIKMRDEKE